MSRRGSGAVALVLLILVAACGSAGSEPEPERSPTSGRLVATTCADLVVLGARGNGQSPTGNHGVGREVLRTVTALARIVDERSGASVRLEAVPYDATGIAPDGTFSRRATAGARLAARQAGAIARQCPDSRIAAVGFSQGAQVVHTFAVDVDPAVARRIVVIGMIADPRRDPADAIRHWSYASDPVPRPGLLGAGAPIDADVRAAAISFCTADDEVCNGRGRPGLKTSPVHRFFYERHETARVTATQLDAVLQANGF